MTIGKQVAAERKRQDLTQDELKTKAGISLDTLCRIEQDKANPTLYVIQALQKALGISFKI